LNLIPGQDTVTSEIGMPNAAVVFLIQPR